MTRSQHDGYAGNAQTPSGVDRYRVEHLSRDRRSGPAHRRAFVEDLQRHARGPPPGCPSRGPSGACRPARSSPSAAWCFPRKLAFSPGSERGGRPRAGQADPRTGRRRPRQRGSGGDVIDRLTLAHEMPAATQPVDDLLQRQLIAQDRIEDHALLGQYGVQGLGLGHRAGEPVEQESAPAAEASGPFPDHLDDQAVGHEFAPPMASRAVFNAGLGSDWHWAARKTSPVER